jgi:hypothetical protein
MAETGDNGSPAAEDAAHESVVLQQLLDLHPTQITVSELLREVGGEFADFAERDAIERAIRDLVGAGLLHNREDFIVPSRAALRFNELLDL